MHQQTHPGARQPAASVSSSSGAFAARAPRRAVARAAALLAASLLACALPAQAQDARDTGLSWKLSGFGTLGVAHSDERSADFTASVLRKDGAGYTHPWSMDVDSRLGAQLDLGMGPWSAVLQVVSEQRLDGSYRPEIEWANVKYQLTPEIALRAGRIALPVFLAAEYRKVGYALPWVRTPVDVYGTLPISSSDGVDATWRWSTGALRHNTQVLAGSTNRELANGLKIRAGDIRGISHSFEYGALSGRVTAFGGRLSTGIGKELFDALRQFGPAGDALAERHAIEDKRVRMLSAGASYDPGPWFVTAEYGQTRTSSLLGDGSSMYVGAGLRRGAFTPYAGYAQVRSDGPTSDPGLPSAGLPPPLAGAAQQLNAGLNAFLSTIPVQSTWSAGVRWDAAPDIALKVQFDHVRPQDGSRGTLINQQPDFRSGRAFGIASVALDFVF